MRRALICCALLPVLLVACEPEDGVLSAGDAAPPDATDANISDDSEAGDAGDTTDSEDATPDEETADVPPDVGLPEGVIAPRFDPKAADFYRLPWPSDARVTRDGTPDYSDFPNAGQSMVRAYINAFDHIHGYSTMPVVYTEMAGSMDRLTLPTPRETLDDASPVQLLDVSAEGCGARVPIELRYTEAGDTMRGDRVLSATPVPGFVLQPTTPYAFIITDSLGAADGLTATRPEAFSDVLVDPDGAWAASLEPLWSCASSAGLSRDALITATVFTTQEPTAELRAVRAAVIDPAKTAAPTLLSFADAGQRGRVSGTLETFEGSYETPIYQAGETPYAERGGRFVFVDGEPAIQRWESVRFTLSIPAKGTAPYPVLIWQDGTGAGLYRYLSRETIRLMAQQGYAIASFQPQMHGERSGSDADAVLHSFNFINPEAGRTVFRQQVVDTAYFIRVLREAVALRSDVSIDTTRLLYGGHSQGAIVGAMIAGVETELEAYVLNGIGSYLSETIVNRKDPQDIAALTQLLLGTGGPVDTHHPAVQLAQLGADAVDPHNYARSWRGFPGRPQGTHVFLTNGMNDPTTYPRSINAITIAGDLDVLAPPGWDVDPEDVWSGGSAPLPLSQNRSATDGTPLTHGSYLNAETGHHTLSDLAPLRTAAVQFWTSARAGDAIIPTF